MKLGIMQPYFLPYVGYFQLIAAVDEFIVYDNIQYTKKGWINRNRLLVNGSEALFSLPLRSDSDYLDVRERELSDQFDRRKLLNQFAGAYRRAPEFAPTFALLESIVGFDQNNLFDFVFNSIREVCTHLSLETRLRISSDIPIDHDAKGQDKVLALCEAIGASTYINASGGVDLYSATEFRHKGVELKFLKSNEVAYPQFGAPFVPWLSIIDVLMFNPVEKVRDIVVREYQLA